LQNSIATSVIEHASDIDNQSISPITEAPDLLINVAGINNSSSLGSSIQGSVFSEDTVIEILPRNLEPAFAKSSAPETLAEAAQMVLHAWKQLYCNVDFPYNLIYLGDGAQAANISEQNATAEI